MSSAANPLATVARLLEQAAVPYVVIGAHAVNAWVEPRITADIDVTAAADVAGMTRLERTLAAQGWSDGVRVASPEDLIVLKLIANRPKDQVDLLALVALPDLDWSYVERWADAWGVRELLERLRSGM